MKEIFSISTGIDVAKAKPTAKDSKEVVGADNKTSAKDFLSVMFAQVKESIKITDEGSKLSLNVDSSLENTKVELSTEGEKKAVDSHLLEDLLKIISLLKNPDANISSFPSHSNKLTKLINSETSIKELKDINNITDLLKLSKKYDLGLEKISVKNMDLKALEKEFPTLAKKEFFSIAKNEIPKDGKLVVEKKEIETKPTVLSINNIEKPKTETKKEPTLFEKIMSYPKDEKKEVAVQAVKESTKEKVIEEKKENVTVKVAEEIKKSIKVIEQEAPKVVVPKDEMKAKVVVPKEELHVKVENDTKKPAITRVEDNIPKKGMIESILQSIKTDKPKSMPQAATVAQSSLETDKKEPVEIKTESTANRVEIKPQIKTDALASKQLSPSKDTFNNFAAEFKEKLENYKPPFMRVQLALNPKGLGEVDVTIVNRGNNLHVNITSNTNTMSLFTQNQAEFKNSLVNMGFTNLEMNFSDQREKQEQNSKNTKESSGFFEEESLEEETTSIELIVPQYI